MNEINKTLYIPLYGKAQVSKKGIILKDKFAEQIWSKEHFELKGKAKSKWLTYFMSMRAKVFDLWTTKQITKNNNTIVLHIGCGLDSRYQRIHPDIRHWYDLDFPDVIAERKKYFTENNQYTMLNGDATNPQEWIDILVENQKAIIVLEGVSMYMPLDKLKNLFSILSNKYAEISIFTDVYTTFGAWASKYKNPINEVGVTTLYGIDDPFSLITNNNIRYIGEHTMTPEILVNELQGFEKMFFKLMFTGRTAKKIYRLHEYSSVH